MTNEKIVNILLADMSKSLEIPLDKFGHVVLDTQKKTITITLTYQEIKEDEINYIEFKR